MEIIKDIEQGTDEWLALRYGWTTASLHGEWKIFLC